MSQAYKFEETFKKVNFSETPLPKGDYEVCTFSNCNFANANLRDINFNECTFNDCDFSSAKINRTTFGEVQFKDCKMIGLHFEDCNQVFFSVDFDQCQLDLSSFFQMKLEGQLFKGCSLQEVDFNGTNLSQSSFQNCNLRGALFEKTNLQKADFRTALNFSIAPDLNRIKGAKFSVEGALSLLARYEIDVNF